MTKLTTPFLSNPAGNQAGQWAESRSVFPIYLALAKQLGIPIPFAQRNLPENAGAGAFQ